MIRPDYETQIKPSAWTFEEGLHHVTGTFDRAARQWPDIMEPYVNRLGGLDDKDRKRLMQAALRETFTARLGA